MESFHRILTRMRKLLLCASAMLLVPAQVGAQTYRDVVARLAGLSSDLTFPAEASELSVASRPSMAIYKPSGEGPFPALVILPSCGGLRSEIADWARRAVARGYVAFVVDPLAQRGLPHACVPGSPANHYRGTKDAFQALAHLKRFAFVDSDRVGVLGFSWGAMVSLLASSQTFAELFSPERRFAAAVGLYPLCHVDPMQGRPAVDFVRPDHDRPALILLGDQDTEAPAEDCVARLKSLADKQLPVQWHVYSGATHCWDCSSLNNFSKTDFRGVRVVYRFDRDVTEDSARRAFEYFDARLKSR
jgi:dienelactone hydrolase